MRFETGILGSYWELADICAIYLKNRSLTREKNVIWWEVWYDKCLSVKHYRVLSCPVYMQISKDKKSKLSNKKWKQVFVNCCKDTNQIWKIWNLVDHKIKNVTSVTFHKTFSNKRSENLFEFLADNFNQKLDIKANTNLDFDDTDSFLQTQ